MLNDLFPAIMVLGIAYAIYKIFELYVRRKERMLIIEKMSFGDSATVPPNVSKWFSPPNPIPASWSLRIGLLLTGLGLGLSIGVITNYCMGEFSKLNEYISRQRWETLYFSLMLLFGGLGLTIAYLMEQKNRKKDSV